MRFQIISDSACDLPRERVQELSVEIVFPLKRKTT